MGRPKRRALQEPGSAPWAPAKNVTDHQDRNFRYRPGLGPSCGLRGIKHPGKQSWLLIDVHGTSQEVRAGKHVIMKRAHLPARDLRMLDPLLSYPSSILGREHAIVVNLEHIKTIITAQEVFLLDYQNPMVVPFVHDLKCRLPLNITHKVNASSFLHREIHTERYSAALINTVWSTVLHILKRLYVRCLLGL